jgi:hypothetical protein
MLFDALKRWGIADVSHRDLDEGVLRSETGELARSFKEGVLRIDAPRTQAAVGFLGGRRVETTNLVAEMTTAHCVVALASIDGEPIARSRRLLVTVVGQAQNTGQDVREGMVYTFGDPPVLYRPAAGRITLRGLAGPLVGTAWEVAGGRVGPLALDAVAAGVSFEARTDGPIAYYELAE